MWQFSTFRNWYVFSLIAQIHVKTNKTDWNHLPVTTRQNMKLIFFCACLIWFSLFCNWKGKPLNMAKMISANTDRTVGILVSAVFSTTNHTHFNFFLFLNIVLNIKQFEGNFILFFYFKTVILFSSST